MSIRLLLAESSTGYGGTAKYLASLLPLLDKDRYEISIVAAERGPFIERIESDGWEVHLRPRWRFPWQPANLVTIAAQLFMCVPETALWLRRRRIQLVHLNNEIYSHIPMIVAARIAGCKILCHLHGWRPLFRLEKLFSRWIDAFVSVTEAGARFYSKELAGRPVQSVPNGLTSEELALPVNGLRREFRGELGIPDNAFLIVLAGRLIPLKGHPFFLEAFEKASKLSRRPLAALFVGSDPSKDGRYLSRLRAEAESRGLTEKIRFVPWVENMKAVYSASDLVVQPSVEPESFGLTLLEAMALEKPVIATFLGGMTDVVKSGETGLMVEPGNAEEFAQAMLKIAENPSFAEQLGRRGRERALALFNMEQNAGQIRDIYDSFFINTKALQGV